MSIKTIPQFIDLDFQNWLIWYWQQLPDKSDTGQKIRAFLHQQLPWTKKLHHKLHSMLAPHEDRNFIISTAYLSNDYAPGGIHSDGWLPGYPEKHISHTYLIPLAYEGEQHTLVFDQTSQEAVTFNSVLGLGNAGIVNYKQANPKSVLHDDKIYIPQEVYNKYLTHLSYDGLQGLTINSVMTWKTNSAVCWPREHFHCAANYLPGQKRFALILMTCYTE